MQSKRVEDANNSLFYSLEGQLVKTKIEFILIFDQGSITNRWIRALFSITKRKSKEIQYDIAHYRNPSSDTKLLSFYTKQQLIFPILNIK
ncbi:hypothetical protein T03_153 [Trichinella britovi]|uniref:Uncharacterized protein n=1 Tax=Trichinella britovi TaxID=45882 RepID=A0A0V1CYR7_TRIBR|nr:hypothetical protein T03_153 [Trichinella britovi]